MFWPDATLGLAPSGFQPNYPDTHILLRTEVEKTARKLQCCICTNTAGSRQKNKYWILGFWGKLTITPSHPAGDLHENPCVAEDHDDQRQEEEAHEGEHIVDGLLPVLHEAAVGGALCEVGGDSDGHVVKQKHLHDQKKKKKKSSRLERNLNQAEKKPM